MLIIGSDCCVLDRKYKEICDNTGLRWSEISGIVIVITLASLREDFDNR